MVLTVVNFVECDEKLIVLTKVLEQNPEFLAFGNVVIAVCILRLLPILGSHVRSHQNWFSSKKIRQLHYISHTLVNLSKRKIAVAIHVESRPIFVSFCLVF